jgi:hypothetical protein
MTVDFDFFCTYEKHVAMGSIATRLTILTILDGDGDNSHSNVSSDHVPSTHLTRVTAAFEAVAERSACASLRFGLGAKNDLYEEKKKHAAWGRLPRQRFFSPSGNVSRFEP